MPTRPSGGAMSRAVARPSATDKVIIETLKSDFTIARRRMSCASTVAVMKARSAPAGGSSSAITTKKPSSRCWVCDDPFEYMTIGHSQLASTRPQSTATSANDPKPKDACVRPTPAAAPSPATLTTATQSRAAEGSLGLGELTMRGGQPHWSSFQAAAFQAAPFQAAPFQAAPFQAAPFQAAPFQAAPFQAAPFQAAPFQAAPFQAAPFQVSPLSGAVAGVPVPSAA